MGLGQEVWGRWCGMKYREVLAGCPFLLRPGGERTAEPGEPVLEWSACFRSQLCPSLWLALGVLKCAVGI